MARTISSTTGGLFGIGFRRARADLLQDLFDAILTGDGIVVHEPELGRPPEAEPRANLAAEEWRGPTQRARAEGARLLVSERSIEHPRQLEIRAHLHARQGDESDARVVDLPRQKLRQFAPNLIADPFRPRLHRQITNVRSAPRSSPTMDQLVPRPPPPLR